MEQPRFPVVLVVLVALFGFIAISSEVVWIKIIAVIGALFVAAAAVYQSMPQRDEQDPVDNDQPE
ncbi:MAG: hypothetical protein ACR2FE_00330 [Aeromicrobium sp.]